MFVSEDEQPRQVTGLKMPRTNRVLGGYPALRCRNLGRWRCETHYSGWNGVQLPLFDCHNGQCVASQEKEVASSRNAAHEPEKAGVNIWCSAGNNQAQARFTLYLSNSGNAPGAAL